MKTNLLEKLNKVKFEKAKENNFSKSIFLDWCDEYEYLIIRRDGRCIGSFYYTTLVYSYRKTNLFVKEIEEFIFQDNKCVNYWI